MQWNSQQIVTAKFHTKHTLRFFISKQLTEWRCCVTCLWSDARTLQLARLLMYVMCCRCLSVGWSNVRVAVSTLLCSKLEPTCRLLTCWLQNDGRRQAVAMSSSSSSIFFAGRCTLHCNAVLQRDYMDVCRGLAASQWLLDLPSVQVLH